MRIGRALGYPLEPIGPLEPDLPARAHEDGARALEEVEALMLASAGGNTRSELQRPSMGQDLLKGRRTEIDFMNGFIAAKGAEVGLAAPSHARLRDIVKRVERGELAAGAENLYGG